MASYYWMKLYIEVLDDPKMGKLSDTLWRRFFELCLIAKEFDRDGRLPPLPDVAWRLRVDEENLRQEMITLEEIGLMMLSGKWRVITNFAKRQASMSDKERVARYRKKKRRGNVYVTKRNTEVEEEVEQEGEEEQEPDSGGRGRRPNIFIEYENTFGAVAPGLVDELKEFENEYQDTWIVDAFTIARDNGARGWGYVKAILKNWEQNGRNGHKPDDDLAGLRAAAEELYGYQ